MTEPIKPPLSRRDFLKLAGAGAGALLVGCAPGPVRQMISTVESPTPTRMPDHMPLPIVEQTIADPVTIPEHVFKFDSTFADSGSLEFAYQRESGQSYAHAYGWGAMIVHGDKVIVFANRLAFDRRIIIEGLPEFWAEDRWVWDTEQKIEDFVTEHRLAENKNVVMVNAQTYAVSGGAEWEVVAFGGGVEPQRWLQTPTDENLRRITP